MQRSANLAPPAARKDRLAVLYYPYYIADRVMALCGFAWGTDGLWTPRLIF